MKVEEAVVWLKRYQGYEPFENGTFLKHSFDLTDETVDAIISAISGANIGEPLTMEQLREKVGQPVVIKYSYGGPYTFAIVDVRYVPHLGADKIRLVFADGYITVNERDYGTYFTTCAYPPAHIDRDAWEPCDDCDSCRSCCYSDTDMDSYPCRICTDGNMKETSNFCPECGRPLTKEAWAELEKRVRG